MPELITDTWLAAARGLHIGACLLCFSVWLFDRLIAAPALAASPASAQSWRRVALRLWAPALAAALLSGLLWLVVLALTMSGQGLRAALAPEVLGLVLNQTNFGRLWKWRAILLLASALAGTFAFRRRTAPSAWLALAAHAFLLATLAFAGHGGDAPTPWHPIADTLHLLAAGCWPAALLPLAATLFVLRQSNDPARPRDIAALTRRFSILSVTAATLLVATGLGNSCMMLAGPTDLLTTPYGRVLLAKIACLAIMIAIGAVNLIRLRPQLIAESDIHQNQTARRLQLNIAIELALTTLVIALVALLGMMEPARH